jgi:hypothetical protein
MSNKKGKMSIGGTTSILMPQVLIGQYNFNAALGKRFFRDAPGVADPVRAAAVHALAGFHAGRFQVRMSGSTRRSPSTPVAFSVMEPPFWTRGIGRLPSTTGWIG